GPAIGKGFSGSSNRGRPGQGEGGHQAGDGPHPSPGGQFGRGGVLRGNTRNPGGGRGWKRGGQKSLDRSLGRGTDGGDPGGKSSKDEKRGIRLRLPLFLPQGKRKRSGGGGFKAEEGTEGRH